MLSAARSFLADRRQPGGGWSYGGDVPPDADSTAWCLMALRGSRSLGGLSRQEARAFLREHRTEDGFATYLKRSGIGAYIAAPPMAPLAGWTAGHADVTASSLLAGIERPSDKFARRVLARLIEGQSAAGFWSAYWWREPFYTTALVLRNLDKRSLTLPRERSVRVLRGLAREQLPDGGFGLGSSVVSDPFTTALALECFCRLSHVNGYAVERDAAAECLVTQACSGGGWSGDYVMRIPSPEVSDPSQVSDWAVGAGGGNSYVLDENGVFATTLGCYALKRLARV